MKAASPAQRVEVASTTPGPTAIKPMFVVGGLYSLANGVAWIMRDLAAALGRAGSPVDVYAADCWGRGAASVGHIFEPPSRWVSAKGLWLGGLSWSPALKPQIREAVARHDVVHHHSLWMLPTSYASHYANQAGKPVVITAHGALEPWALGHSGWKKRLVGKAFQNEDLQRASCLHVNSQAEIAGIRAYELRHPIAVIPNGVYLPDYDCMPPAGLFAESFPETKDKRIALFMARLHRKKGVEHLIQAWSRLQGEFRDWHLVIAGPDSGYEQTARELIDEHQIDRSVTLTGNLQGEAKRAALSAAGLFVQPSYSEGFSMSIVEAMACRLPVLMTPGCNFSEAAQAGAAISVEPNADATEEGMRHLLSLSECERTEIGERGRRLIERGYTWDLIAGKTLRLYDWLMSGGSRPEFVVHDGD